jgi:hypothetical protein
VPYLTILKTLLATIKTVEALMPDSPGKDKFDACISIVSAVAGDVTGILPQLTTIVGDVVDGLHAVGLFTHSADAPIAAAA